MTASNPLNVLFRVAAGPQIGFGHLARSRSLSRALGVVPLVSVRGSLRTQSTAAALGWALVSGASDTDLAALRLDLIVVDDPSRDHAERWVRKARRLGVPVASIHDLGLGQVDSDLVIDGSVTPSSPRPGVASLRGPLFTILDPAIARLRAQERVPMFGRVMIALGGGAHVYSVAGRLSRALITRLPALDIRVACGFAQPRHLPVLPRGSWIASPDGLGAELAASTIAVVAGGVTLYEACALGVPVVTLPVTAAQHQATRAFACHGAALDAGWPLDDRAIERAADLVAALCADSKRRERMSADGRRLVDGNGAFRVASQLRQLVNGAQEGTSDAA